ncbi:MAG TPA: metallophosphoesterase, partial [Cyclobacteriaceae bacterium]|nr:metallophosphoesterase [Cyclobacteriaceae bacterium]
IDGTKLRLVVVDTSPFDKSLYGDPAFIAKVRRDTTTQKHWMDSVFSLKDADWTLVAGHHPVYTGGARANQYNPVGESLLPIFSRYNIPVYFSGHEHDLQHLRAPNHPTHQFISGAGSELRATGAIPITKFSASIQGCMSMEITKNTFDVYVISYQLDTLYRVSIKK